MFQPKRLVDQANQPDEYFTENNHGTNTLYRCSDILRIPFSHTGRRGNHGVYGIEYKTRILTSARVTLSHGLYTGNGPVHDANTSSKEAVLISYRFV